MSTGFEPEMTALLACAAAALTPATRAGNDLAIDLALEIQRRLPEPPDGFVPVTEAEMVEHYVALLHQEPSSPPIAQDVRPMTEQEAEELYVKHLA